LVAALEVARRGERDDERDREEHEVEQDDERRELQELER